MPYEPNEVEARGLKKEKEFLRFFAEDDDLFQESKKEALDTLKRNSGRLKHQSRIKASKSWLNHPIDSDKGCDLE